MKNNFYSPVKEQKEITQLANAKGTILSVDPLRRTYTIHVTSIDPKINDVKYNNVQLLNASSSMLGEESGALAEINTICAVTFVGTTPYIMGFLNPIRLTTSKDPSKEKNIDQGVGNEGAIEGSTSGSKGTLDAGDYAISTRGGNKIVVRRSGIIECEAKKTCRTNYFPQEDKIFHMCRKFEFHSDAVTEFHTSSPSTTKSPTYFFKKYINQIEGESAIVQERGEIPDLNKEIIERVAYGKFENLNKKNTFIKPSYVKETYSSGKIVEAIECGTPSPTEDNSAWYKEQKEDGEFIISCGKKVWRMNVKNDGNTTLKINEKFSFEIEPSGKVYLNINEKFKLNIESSGDFSVNSNEKFKLNINESGNFSINSNDKLKINGSESGSLNINYAESITLNGDKGESINLKNSKVSIGNTSVELINILCETLDTLSKTTAKGFGAPIDTVPKFLELFSKLETLKM